ncbi:heme peroxidase family protein [Streptomonospora sp. S1-112]|uniref:Heme peroxidase family protein n=1 Tax=Streptomonospora mangrovi TaxID=2883123 RepID=A0A9X3NQC3_9ACTN|nr:heme peroxidase family protein [Streptomonospora mangrovi]MDA0566341.1 heme peroxidase family protein [Streptomonospora mangrovi]
MKGSALPVQPEQRPVEVAGAGAALPQPDAPARTHGFVQRGLARVPESPLFEGRFGRMFRRLRPLLLSRDEIADLAARMADQPPAEPELDNPGIPAGYTYLGQFIDHDLTFDPTPLQARQDDPDALTNFRTPRFDLDCLYGRGPADQPYLYDAERPGRFLIGRHDDQFDLPRNEQQTALIGDPRNDENIIVSQLQLTMLLFHNAVLDRAEELRAAEPAPEPDDFTLAQRIVRWHYQWVVVHDFLRRIVGEETLDAVLRREPRVPGGRPVEKAVPEFFRWRRAPFIPVEFSGAAYRFGHSLVRARYKFNTTVPALPIFTPEPIAQSDPLSHLGGFRILPPVWQIEWPRFFPLEEGREPVPARAVDTRIVPPLLELPPEAAAGVASLVERNLTRGVRLGLPSGQAVAGAMGLDPLSHADLGLPRRGGAPLWYYVLREAEVLAGGRHLGPVGGRIVAEVFVGLLAADPSSYLSTDPAWTPTLPSARPGEFTMSDLIRFTGFGLAEV